MLSIEKQNAIIGLRDDEPFGQVRQRREALGRVLRTLASKPRGPVEEADRPELVRERVKLLRGEAQHQGDDLTVIDCDVVLMDATDCADQVQRDVAGNLDNRRRLDQGSCR